ncbi:hypothetical protein DPMN_155743 [Dreissena polymorpha]|uniref:Uncharacterized protein n=1 Tax=Dreissena polymorpha TaxID=45954 RepID=A0A9D4FNH6_DREPO|nr:hypothetical protein DPMN_155743 [Dreissena polymorpha]
MAQISDAIRKTPELKGKWKSTIQPVQQIVAERFQRLTLKDIPFKKPEPVQDAEIDQIQRHLQKLFPDLDLSKLQKLHTPKSSLYQS